MTRADQFQPPRQDSREHDTVELAYVVCDVFTSRALAGNQLAVFPNAEDVPVSLRAALAREMNYSESTFVAPSAGSEDASISIYTPSRELRFAGHPLLGTAAVLANAADRDLVLRTPVSLIPLEVRAAGPGIAEVWMEQPWPERVEVDESLIRTALRASGGQEIAGYDNGARFALVDLGNREAVANASPDLAALARLDHGVLCYAGARSAWKARMFAPGLGVSEDPATGSAAGPLVVHLHAAGRLAPEGAIEIEQGAEIGRPSTLRAQVTEVSGHRSVRVGGHVVIVARGTFTLPGEVLASAG